MHTCTYRSTTSSTGFALHCICICSALLHRTPDFDTIRSQCMARITVALLELSHLLSPTPTHHTPGYPRHRHRHRPPACLGSWTSGRTVPLCLTSKLPPRLRYTVIDMKHLASISPDSAAGFTLSFHHNPIGLSATYL